MAICPATLQPCIDDLCRAGGCLRMPDVPPLMKCVCNELVGIDGSDPLDACACYEDDGNPD